MQSLSRPYQIALGALLVLVLAWFTVLKPSDEVVPEADPVGMTAAPGEARAAVDAANASSAAVPGAVPVTPAAAPSAPAVAPVTKAPAAPARAEVRKPDRAAPILEDLDAGRVAVVAFLQPEGGDDRAVRAALRAVDRRGGKVRVRTASIEDVADFSSITSGVTVTQAPTVLVIGTDRRARKLVGLLDAVGLEQTVSDVGGFGARPAGLGYAERVGAVCRETVLAVASRPSGSPQAYFEQVDGALSRSSAASKRLEVPRRFRAFHREWVSYIGAVRAQTRVLAADLGNGENPQRTFAAFIAEIGPKDAAMQRAAGDAGVRCA